MMNLKAFDLKNFDLFELYLAVVCIGIGVVIFMVLRHYWDNLTWLIDRLFRGLYHQTFGRISSIMSTQRKARELTKASAALFDEINAELSDPRNPIRMQLTQLRAQIVDDFTTAAADYGGEDSPNPVAARDFRDQSLHINELMARIEATVEELFRHGYGSKEATTRYLEHTRNFFLHLEERQKSGLPAIKQKPPKPLPAFMEKALNRLPRPRRK